MYIVGNLLFWAHFMGLGMAVGCGIALSATGPKLATPEREQFWPVFTFLSRMVATGLVVLLVTGPLMIWLKFGGVSAFNGWFWAKMNFVGLTIAGVGLQEWARARFARGDEGAGALMAIGGPLTGIAAAAAIFCAVFAFN
jgi:protoporphyrinogen IX oxidase